MADIQIEIKVKERLKTPSRYKVLLHNDNVTPVEFVIELLEKLFGKSKTEARELTMQVHTQGKAVIAVYSYEIAKTKVDLVLHNAKMNGFPLKASCEKE